MTGQYSEDSGHFDHDDAELDTVLDRAMSGILSKLEAGFDPQAGLADVYARSGKATRANRPPDAASPAREQDHAHQGHEPVSGRLQEVCDHIDMLDACLTAVIDSAQADPFGGAAFVEMARPALAQLRMGLANRTLPRNQAERLVDSVQSSLDQADRILRAQHAFTLEQVVRTRIGTETEFGGTVAEQTQILREKVVRLYSDAGYAGSLVPVV